MIDKILNQYGLTKLALIVKKENNNIFSASLDKDKVIVKLSSDIESLKQEAVALRCFSGFGCVKILYEGEGYIIQEYVIPGAPLKSYFSEKDIFAVKIASKLMKSLHQTLVPKNSGFLHLSDIIFSSKIGRISSEELPEFLQQFAINLSIKLLDTCKTDVLLHGDLHHDNIL